MLVKTGNFYDMLYSVKKFPWLREEDLQRFTKIFSHEETRRSLGTSFLLLKNNLIMIANDQVISKQT